MSYAIGDLKNEYLDWVSKQKRNKDTELMKYIWFSQKLSATNNRTACCETFHLEEGSPKDNNMKYCCYCGKKIKESRADV